MDRRIFGLENEYGVTCTLRGQRRLSPDEVARYLFRRVVSWGRSSNVFLQNGARLYLDVGSHLGYFGILMATVVGSSGSVVCFEPDPGLHEALTGNVTRNDELIPAAACVMHTHMPFASALCRLADPHIEARKMVVEIDHPKIGRMKSLGIPVKSTGELLQIRRAAPWLESRNSTYSKHELSDTL